MTPDRTCRCGHWHLNSPCPKCETGPWSDTEMRGCPGCAGVPRGQRWLCKVCRGSGLVSQRIAVAYCDKLVEDAEAALGRAHAALKAAIFGG